MTSSVLDKPRTLSESEFNQIKKLSQAADLAIPDVARRYGEAFKGLAGNEDPYKVLSGPKFDKISEKAFETLSREINGTSGNLSSRASDFINSQWDDIKKNMGAALHAIKGRETSAAPLPLKPPVSDAEISNVAAYINNFLKNAAKVNPEYSKFSPDPASIKSALAFNTSGSNETVLAKGSDGGSVEFKISKDNLEKISKGHASTISNQMPKKEIPTENSGKPVAQSTTSSFAFER